MKKIICLCLALAAVFALMAGCQKNVNIGPTEPTTIPVNEDDLNNAMGQLGEDLDAAAQEALRKALAQGVTLPPATQPPATMPPTMPAGNAVDAAEARALMKKVLDIFATGKFMIKARSSSPFAAGGNTATPVTVAFSEDTMAFETEMDWTSNFNSEGTGAMSTIQAATAQTMFGKKMRIITKSDGISFVFPEKKMYMSMADMVPEGQEMPEFDMTGAMGGIFKDTKSIDEQLNKIKSSKVTANGKEYLCAEVDTDGNKMRYFFLGGELKRIEAQAEGESVMWEIETLTGKVDASFFSTSGMRTMDISQLANLGSLGGILG